MESIWHMRSPAEEPVVAERPAAGRPHEGKVLAAIQSHADDIPFFCAGTVAKLVAEGYKAYLIQTTNDEMCGPSPSIGETVRANEREVETMAEAVGFERIYFLGYRNHLMDGISPLELRRAAHLSLSAVARRHGVHVQPLGPPRGEPRSLGDGQSRRGGPLDGRHGQGLSRAL